MTIHMSSRCATDGLDDTVIIAMHVFLIVLIDKSDLQVQRDT